MVKYTDIKTWGFVGTSGNGMHEDSSHAEDHICHMATEEDTNFPGNMVIYRRQPSDMTWLRATDATVVAVIVFVDCGCKENWSCKAPSLRRCSEGEGTNTTVAKIENLFYVRILPFITLLTAELELAVLVLQYFWMLIIVSCWCPKNWAEKFAAHQWHWHAVDMNYFLKHHNLLFLTFI